MSLEDRLKFQMTFGQHLPTNLEHNTALFTPPFVIPLSRPLPHVSAVSNEKTNQKRKNRTRSRKANGLKFHNFVANSDSPVGRQHSSTGPSAHCLREEHGTKQVQVNPHVRP